jgi:hypothetical protein
MVDHKYLKMPFDGNGFWFAPWQRFTTCWPNSYPCFSGTNGWLQVHYPYPLRYQKMLPQSGCKTYVIMPPPLGGSIFWLRKGSLRTAKTRSLPIPKIENLKCRTQLQSLPVWWRAWSDGRQGSVNGNQIFNTQQHQSFASARIWE